MIFTIILKFLTSNWRMLLGIGILILAISMGMSWIKDRDAANYKRGSDDTAAKYELVIKDYNDKINLGIGNIEALSRAIVLQNDNNSKILSKELNTVLLAIKDKPMYVIKDGKCTPSQEFIDSYNSLISKGSKE